jgi:hypothetical protein
MELPKDGNGLFTDEPPETREKKRKASGRKERMEKRKMAMTGATRAQQRLSKRQRCAA